MLFTIKSAQLIRALSAVSKASGKPKTHRTHLASVFFRLLENDELDIVGTNGHSRGDRALKVA